METIYDDHGITILCGDMTQFNEQFGGWRR